MAFGFKEEYKEFYLPSAKPLLVDVPPMNDIAVRGKGNPNDEDGENKASLELLYGIYLSDPRKTVPYMLKTVIRYPVKSTLHL